MARTSTANRSLLGVEGRALGRGALAGLVAGVGMGLLLQVGTGLIAVLGAFAGEASPLRGWLVHLAIAVAYGGAYAAVVAYPAIADFVSAGDLREHVLLGVTYATMIAAASIAVLPFLFAVPWAPAPSAVSTAGVPGAGGGGLVPAGVFAIAHLVYGAVLGAAYFALTDSEDL